MTENNQLQKLILPDLKQQNYKKLSFLVVLTVFDDLPFYMKICVFCHFGQNDQNR